MTSHRKAGAPRLIEWTGERCVPWAPDVPVIYEHFHRYLWAAQIVRGRRVLDLGSGEGFGAAILADLATEVVGLDIDETAVEHSRLNYQRPGLTFERGSVTDLSVLEPDTFDAVVAFEVIEHVAEHEQVLAEIRRVLREDGVLIMSTPDRQVYSELSGYRNPFHVRELSLQELVSLIGTQFQNQMLFGQRMVVGSQINALEPAPADAAMQTSNFFLTRTGDEWQVSSTFSPRYLITVASNAQLGAQVPTSTLADPELELVCQKEEQIAGLRADVQRMSEAYEQLYERLVATDSELALARHALKEIEASVSFRLVRRLSARSNRLVSKESRPARLLQATLRLIKRVFLRRG
jgi:SAM-dependent methyltransferase